MKSFFLIENVSNFYRITSRGLAKCRVMKIKGRKRRTFKNNIIINMEYTLEQLEHLVIKWADEKGILAKATPMTQFSKTVEEVKELELALEAQEQGLEVFINAKGKEANTGEEIMDAIGDIVVTLTIQAKMQGLTLAECLESAYNVISKRSGEIRNGVFVKSEDL